MRNRLFMISGLATVAILASACASSSSGMGAYGGSSNAPASASPMAGKSASVKTVVLRTLRTSSGRVLTNSKGFALYWYAEDTPNSSKCTGSCASTWPPLLGKPEAAMGVNLTGGLGTIARPDGTIQATYKGHPLYLYVLDTKAGKITGNGVGGEWHVMLKKAAANNGGSMSSPTQSSGSSGGGGGYKY
jgi:predicted lipoprotein with Yx(FWY)xxD motif